jgi:DNA modification methylase
MPTLAEASIDAVVTDPPYGLSFMGKHWDHGVPGVAFWAEALRLLKPGARLLAFGGTRTYHRMACAIEDAGFEIEDSLCWLYGSGFPKHKSKLKPAHEPIVMARKPAPRATLLNIDACRIGTETITSSGWTGMDARRFAQGTRPRDYTDSKQATPSDHSGRWPANVVLDEVSARALDAETGERPASFRSARTGNHTSGWGLADNGEPFGYTEPGGPSRYFYCAKASRSEREAGLADAPRRNGGSNAKGFTDDVARGLDRNRPVANHHPTVKPVALMRWLVRLVTPPDGLVLDPFTGSGTTGIAATLEGRRFLGIEREAEYVDIARARIAHAQPSLGVA